MFNRLHHKLSQLFLIVLVKSAYRYEHSFCLVNTWMAVKDYIFHVIIPHVNSPYKTSIDERLIFYNIPRCYSDGEYCHSFAIAAGDIINCYMTGENPVS